MTTYIITQPDGTKHQVAAKTKREAIARANEQGIRGPFTVTKGAKP